MATYNIFQVDAFSDEIFRGNPAAVVPLDSWIEEDLMQKIAAENNLSETAFYIFANGRFEIRWFTPLAEVDLCGHATLASAFVIFNCEKHDTDAIDFYSRRSGALKVTKNGDWLYLTFPSDKIEQVAIDHDIADCFDKKPLKAYKGKSDFMLVFDSEKDILNASPRFDKISKFGRGIIITARGASTDFVSRFFAPQVGVPEDPVTGSAHTTLIPYWSRELAKEELTAVQLSKRGGFLKCKNLNGKVEIGGQARLFLQGKIFV